MEGWLLTHDGRRNRNLVFGFLRIFSFLFFYYFGPRPLYLLLVRWILTTQGEKLYFFSLVFASSIQKPIRPALFLFAYLFAFFLFLGGGLFLVLFLLCSLKTKIFILLGFFSRGILKTE